MRKGSSDMKGELNILFSCSIINNQIDDKDEVHVESEEERENEGGDDYQLNDAKSCDICK